MPPQIKGGPVAVCKPQYTSDPIQGLGFVLRTMILPFEGGYGDSLCDCLLRAHKVPQATGRHIPGLTVLILPLPLGPFHAR